MNILAFTGTAILFALFALVVLFVLVNVSSRLALIILLLVPLFSILLLPETSISFLSYRQMLLANGLVPINNFHILLMLWSTLIGIILYTEFLTWYLGKGIRMKKGNTDVSGAEPLANIRENVHSAIEKAGSMLLKRN